VTQDAIGEGAQGVCVRVNGQDLDGSTFFVEHVHIKPLARQVQSGVQHGWSLPVLVAFDNPTLSPVRFLFMTFHSADETGVLALTPDALSDAYQACGSLAAWDGLRPVSTSRDAIQGELS
jgi:hypothetical protein